MPYQSMAQAAKFHELLARGKIAKKTVNEFDSASKGAMGDLPRRVAADAHGGEISCPHCGARLMAAGGVVDPADPSYPASMRHDGDDRPGHNTPWEFERERAEQNQIEAKYDRQRTRGHFESIRHFAKGGEVGKKAPLGNGKRFSALEDHLAKERGVNDPGAVAAAIGRRKWGSARMAALAEKGEERDSSGGEVGAGRSFGKMLARRRRFGG